MTLQKLISRARVKMKMVSSGMVSEIPTSRFADMVVDSLGIRFSYHSPAYCADCASVVCLDYANESKRTIDDCLELEKSELC